MNRFFRSALFPLVIIAALVWLAITTLGHNGKQTAKVTYSQAIQYAEKGQLSNVNFVPTKQEIDADYGTKSIAVNYPTAESATQFQNILQREKIKFDSSGVGGFSWWRACSSRSCRSCCSSASGSSS